MHYGEVWDFFPGQLPRNVSAAINNTAFIAIEQMERFQGEHWRAE